MGVMKKISYAILTLCLLAACGERIPTGSPAWKDTDKHLNCQQLLLEMNDAEFWNGVAHSKKRMGVTDFLWPPGYIGTRASAEDAIGATRARMENLRRIYEIKGCNNPYPGMNLPPQ
jgi:hypothetical protein